MFNFKKQRFKINDLHIKQNCETLESFNVSRVKDGTIT